MIEIKLNFITVFIPHEIKDFNQNLSQNEMRASFPYGSH